MIFTFPRLTRADDFFDHVQTVSCSTHDPFLLAMYKGTMTVLAATAYELAVKDILINFSRNKHPTFGEYISKVFERKNGRIFVKNIKEDLEGFGFTYKKAFSQVLEASESYFVNEKGISVTTQYHNILTWRNSFVHSGNAPDTATIEEIRGAYHSGKEVIICLAEVMR